MSNAHDLTPLQFWATPFYQRTWRDHSAESAGIIAHLYDLKARETARIASGIAPAAKSATGLFESKFNLFASPHPGLARLVAFATETVRAAVVHIGGSRLDPARLKVNIPDSWFHVTNDGGFHDAHYHGVARGVESTTFRPASQATGLNAVRPMAGTGSIRRSRAAAATKIAAISILTLRTSTRRRKTGCSSCSRPICCTALCRIAANGTGS